MGFGQLVIAPAIGAFKEIVDDAQTCILYQLTVPDSLEDTMARFCSLTREHKRRMGAAALRRVLDQDWSETHDLLRRRILNGAAMTQGTRPKS